MLNHDSMPDDVRFCFSLHSCKVALLLLLGGLAACNMSRAPQPTSRTGVVVPGLTIFNGILALPGHDTVVRSIVLERRDGTLFIREIALHTTTATTDYLNAAGLYVHSAHALEAENPAVTGGAGIFVLRAGPSQGDPARYLVPGMAGLEIRTIGDAEYRVACCRVSHGIRR